MDLGDLFKKAQELSQNMQSQQQELGNHILEVSVGGEMVKMKFNAKLEAISLQIDPEVVNPEDIETLQDLILSAINEGIRRSQKVAQETLGKQLGNLTGIKIPGFTA